MKYDFSLLYKPKDPAKGIPQNTPIWMDARRGRITASDRAYKIMYGRPATIGRMLDEMAEELTKPAVDGATCAAFEHGHAYEERAIREYDMLRFTTGKVQINPGMFIHPTFDIASATPDFFEGDDTTGQVKCPLILDRHKDLLRFGVKQCMWEYFVQVQFEAFVTGRPKIRFVSFHPEAKPLEQLHQEDVPLDEGMQARFYERLVQINHMLVNDERPEYANELDGIPSLF
jgi:hypothetical protein